MRAVWGGIESGGTHFVCAVGSGPDDLVAETRFPTAAPDETLPRAIDFLRSETGDYRLSAIGIASFGPVDLHTSSSTYGSVTSTPKPGWAGVDLVERIRSALAVPIGFDTDVNAAALAEHLWGSGRGLDTFVYLTVGTGIGGGGIVNGRPMHGLVHPEMGHVLLPREPSDDFPGCCPFHGDCLEGLASGPAIQGRWGAPAETLPGDHPAWDLEARYLATALANIICTLSPQRVVVGGGVMERAELLPMVRGRVRDLLRGYLRAPQLGEDIGAYIVPPDLGDRTSVMGALALARQSVPEGRRGLQRPG